jgi:O-antigen/teichoic acid export membrane protein
LLIIISPKKILNLWGGGYSPGFLSLIIISFAQLINCGVGLSGYLITMIGKTKITLINSLIILIITVSSSLLLIPKFGFLGAAISFAIAISLINIIRLLEVYLILKIHPYRTDFFKPLLAGGLSFCIILLSKKYLPKIDYLIISLAELSIIFAFTYCITLYILKISKEELFVLEKIKSKLTLK